MSREASSLSSRVVKAEFSAGAATLRELPPPVSLEVAFAGRSNVGKSSLVNCLLSRRNLVRVSGTPGCTRRIGFYATELADGATLSMVDLPGYGFARRSKQERKDWGELIEGYLLGRATLRAVVIIVDVRRGLEPDDADLFELCASPARVSRPKLETVLVATKLDKVVLSKQKLALAELEARAKRRALGFSSETGEGRERLWRKLRDLLSLSVSPELKEPR
ncbi:MAG: ribosome biogenesis GTP-binding protein YihA/YsxC [Polyangiaceae bacterium]